MSSSQSLTVSFVRISSPSPPSLIPSSVGISSSLPASSSYLIVRRSRGDDCPCYHSLSNRATSRFVTFFQTEQLRALPCRARGSAGRLCRLDLALSLIVSFIGGYLPLPPQLHYLRGDVICKGTSSPPVAVLLSTGVPSPPSRFTTLLSVEIPSSLSTPSSSSASSLCLIVRRSQGDDCSYYYSLSNQATLHFVTLFQTEQLRALPCQARGLAGRRCRPDLALSSTILFVREYLPLPSQFYRLYRGISSYLAGRSTLRRSDAGRTSRIILFLRL